MPILDSLELSLEALKEDSFAESIEPKKVIPKLILSVYALEKEVDDLRKRLNQYNHLNSLLSLEDLSDEKAKIEKNSTKKEPTIVQGLSTDASIDAKEVPVGFTPMYSAPALNDDELEPTTAKNESSSSDRKFVRPWPEVTLNQLASRFKIPRDLLSKTARRLGASKEMDDSNMKPIRGSDIGEGGRTRRPGRPAKQHRGPGRPRKSRSGSPRVKSEGRTISSGVSRQSSTASVNATDGGSSTIHRLDTEGSQTPVSKRPRTETPSLKPESSESSTPEMTGWFSLNNGTSSLTSRGRPAGIMGTPNSLVSYYTRGADGSYLCTLCDKKPFTSYHGIYAHLQSVHYDVKQDRFVQRPATRFSDQIGSEGTNGKINGKAEQITEPVHAQPEQSNVNSIGQPQANQARPVQPQLPVPVTVNATQPQLPVQQPIPAQVQPAQTRPQSQPQQAQPQQIQPQQIQPQQSQQSPAEVTNPAGSPARPNLLNPSEPSPVQNRLQSDMKDVFN